MTAIAAREPACRRSASCRGSRPPHACPPRTRSTLAQRHRAHRGPAPMQMGLLIAVARAWPHIGQIFDDLDPLAARGRACRWCWCRPGEPLPADAALILAAGLEGDARPDLAAAARRGLGTSTSSRMHAAAAGCSGLLWRVPDARPPHCRCRRPRGVPPGESGGLGPARRRDRARAGEDAGVCARARGAARPAKPSPATRVHLGRTRGPRTAPDRCWISRVGRMARSAPTAGSAGCYLHGLFASDRFRAAFLAGARARPPSDLAYAGLIERTLDALADHVGGRRSISTGLLADRSARGECHRPARRAVPHEPGRATT